MVNGVIISVPLGDAVIESRGIAASICAPSNSPFCTRVYNSFQLGCTSSWTNNPSSLKKPFSTATAKGAISVSLTKPIFSVVFSVVD